MNKAFIALGAIVLIVAVAFFSGIGSYNSLVDADERVTRLWADVESQYQRRADLLPNLVSTVQGAADFEQETLEAVTNARARATSINLDAGDLSDPARIAAFEEAQQSLSGALGRLRVVSEK